MTQTEEAKLTSLCLPSLLGLGSLRFRPLTSSCEATEGFELSLRKFVLSAN